MTNSQLDHIEQTEEEIAKDKEYLAAIARRASAGVKSNWRRQRDILESRVADVQAVEEEILELYSAKIDKMDAVIEMREAMVMNCIHPIDQLVVVDHSPESHVIAECKFCNRKITVSKTDPK